MFMELQIYLARFLVIIISVLWSHNSSKNIHTINTVVDALLLSGLNELVMKFIVHILELNSYIFYYSMDSDCYLITKNTVLHYLTDVFNKSD